VFGLPKMPTIARAEMHAEAQQGWLISTRERRGYTRNRDERRREHKRCPGLRVALKKQQSMQNRKRGVLPL